MDNKSKKLIILFSIIVLVAFSGIAMLFSPVTNKNKLGASVSYSSNKYYYFNLEAFTNSLPSSTEEYDYMKVAFALQGLINREQPVLFYHYKPGPYQYVNTYYMEDVWESVLVNNNNILAGKQKVTLNSFDEVIELAKDMGVVNGAVLWDPKVPATSNVASTIAGVENLVPIRKDITNFSCYTDLIVNRGLFAVQKDLTGKFTGTGYLPDKNLNSQSSGTASSGSTKNDAYLWAKKYYLNTNKTNSSLMGYTRDAWIAPCSTKACFVDSWVPQNMTPGEERQVFVTILNNTTGEWSAADNYRIAAANGGSNAFKVTDALYGFEQGNDPANIRLYLDPNNNISVGERYRVTFTIKAPNTAGTYHLNLGAVHDGHRWLGGTIDLTINVGSSSTGNVKTEHYGTYPQGIFNSGLNTSDYLIANKAFFFDLSPDNSIAPIDDRGQTVETDVTTLKSLLSQQKTNANGNIFTVIGFVPWFVKYTSTSDSSSRMEDVAAEWKMIDYISTYNGQSDADAMSPVGLTNASLYRHQPLNSNLTQNNDKEAIKSDAVVKEVYDSNTKYFILFMGDYDCGAWTSGVLPTRFLNTTGNAKYPLTWPIASDLSDRVPQAFNWLYEHQERNDYFVAGDNGTGYLNPMKLDSSGRTTWKNHNISRNSQFDIDITGFLIGGNNTISNTIKSDYASISPVMVGYQGTLESSGSVGSTPFIPSANIAPNTSTLAQDIYNQLNATSSKFIIIRTIQTSRAAAYDAIDQVYAMASANGKKFKLVDPYTMAQLYTDHPTKYKGCYSDGTNYQWVNATTIPSGYSYVNTVSSSSDCHKPRTKIAKPNIVKTSYVYNTNTRRPSIEGLDTSVMAFEGETSATDIGNYTATIRIKDKESYEWEDGTQKDIVINWEITKRILTKPTIEGENKFSYNAETQGITITGYYENYMEKTGDESAVITGNYQVKIALKDRNNCEWEDGTTNSVYLYWYIKKAKLTKPTISGASTFTYNGSSQGPTVVDFVSNRMTKSGTTSKTNVGNYSATYTLKDKNNTSWSDGTTTDVTLNWSITKAKLTKPSFTGDTIFTYDGTAKSVTLTNFNGDTMTRSGALSKIGAGITNVTIALIDSKNYSWTDDSITDLVLSWTINKAELTKPTVDGSTTFTYNGNYQGLSFNDFDSTIMDITGNSEVNVGSHLTIISLKDSNNYEWSDGTTAAESFAWTITKANLDAAVSMADYYEDATPSNPVVTGNLGSGTVTFSYTIKGQDNYSSTKPTTKGIYTVKAVIAATTNYNGQTVTSDFEVMESSSGTIVLPDGSIITDVGLYGELIDSYNTEKGTSYNYTHLFTEQELASLKTLVISQDKYHGVEVEDLSDLSYLTGLENLSIDFWIGCEADTLDLSNNTQLKSLTLNSVNPVEKLNLSNNTQLKSLHIDDSSINVINISNLNLNNIDLSIPETVGYLVLDPYTDVSYITNPTLNPETSISDNSFGISCLKYNLAVGESTTCTVKGKTIEEVTAVIFKVFTTNNNITVSNYVKKVALNGTDHVRYFGDIISPSEFDIVEFTVTAVSPGTTKLYLDDYDTNNRIGYVKNDGNESYIDVTEEISKIFYVNKYKITDTSGNEITTGTILTNYVLNIVDSNGIYQPAYNLVALGDVRTDGIVNIQDVTKAYKGAMKGNFAAYTQAEKYALDMNFDGLYKMTDVIDIYDLIGDE